MFIFALHNNIQLLTELSDLVNNINPHQLSHPLSQSQPGK